MISSPSELPTLTISNNNNPSSLRLRPRLRFRRRFRPDHPPIAPSPSSSTILKPASTATSSIIHQLSIIKLCLLIYLRLHPSLSQSISTNMPLPPMEWIKLNPSGSTSPPALSHGCLSGPTSSDLTTSSPGFHQAFLFGGRSAAGTSSNGIYVLDYSSPQPVWSQPSPSLSPLFTTTPSARSHFICGWDTASNFRNQLNIFGGRSEDGLPLDDFWFYDPTNHFWAQPVSSLPKNHPAIYGSIGGSDPTYAPSPPGTSNAMIYLGGANSSHSSNPLVPSAISIDGQLGSNTNTVNANYSSLANGLTGNASSNNLLNGRWGMTGTIIPGSKIVIFSGCNGDPGDEFESNPDPACSLTNGGILQFQSGFTASQLSNPQSSTPSSSWTAFSYCPAPRIGGTMVPNRNRFDSSYSNQVIMIGGRTDTKNWSDQGGSKLGEVDVLDITSGLWARVLPMVHNNATFTQKEGLLALALPTPIGSQSNTSSTSPTDILVYGGIDVATGQASNELWILRLHSAKLTGNGTADGVTMSYLPSCVTPTPHNNKNATPNSGANPDGDSSSLGALEAPDGHFIFASLAFAIMMCSLTILRCEEPGLLSIRNRWRTGRLWLLIGAWQAFGFSCGFLIFAIVIGLFETSTQTSALTLTKRGLIDGNPTGFKLSARLTLSQSTHARLGLAIGIVALIILPGLYLLSWLDATLEERRLKQLAKSGGARKLRAKGAQRSGVTRWAVEGISSLTQSFLRSRQEKNRQSSRSESISQHPLESLGEKHSDLIVEQPVSVQSAREPSPDLLPSAVPLGHERLGSTSTAYTNTQLLSKQIPSNMEPERRSRSSPPPSSLTQRPSRSKPKPLMSNTERSLARSLQSPFSKVFPNLSSSLFSGGTSGHSNSSKNTPGKTTGGAQETMGSKGPPHLPSPSGGASFEVLNRKPPSRQRGPNLNTPRTRISLDIMSDSGSSSARSSRDHRRKTSRRRSHSNDDARDDGIGGSARNEEADYQEVAGREFIEGAEVEEDEDDDDDDDDDSEYRRRIKARRKLRRLADVVLHSVLLVGNVYLISSIFQSSRDLKWLGIVYTILCVACYGIMFWFAWIGKPSSESTLVIFVSIIKDGSKNLMRNENFPGLGQFSSFKQQQEQQQELAHRILAQQMTGRSSIGGYLGKRSTVGSRLPGFAFYDGSQHGGGYFGGGISDFGMNSGGSAVGGMGGIGRSATPDNIDNYSTSMFLGDGGSGGALPTSPGLMMYGSSGNQQLYHPQYSHPSLNRRPSIGMGGDWKEEREEMNREDGQEKVKIHGMVNGGTDLESEYRSARSISPGRSIVGNGRKFEETNTTMSSHSYFPPQYQSKQISSASNYHYHRPQPSSASSASSTSIAAFQKNYRHHPLKIDPTLDSHSLNLEVLSGYNNTTGSSNHHPHFTTAPTPIVSTPSDYSQDKKNKKTHKKSKLISKSQDGPRAITQSDNQENQNDDDDDDDGYEEDQDDDDVDVDDKEFKDKRYHRDDDQSNKLEVVDNYLTTEREVQIVTTAPKRKLTVVNG